MIGCKTETGVEYITKLEDFRDLIPESVYLALNELISKSYNGKISYLEKEIESWKEDYESLSEAYDELNKK